MLPALGVISRVDFTLAPAIGRAQGCTTGAKRRTTTPRHLRLHLTISAAGFLTGPGAASAGQNNGVCLDNVYDLPGQHWSFNKSMGPQSSCTAFPSVHSCCRYHHSPDLLRRGNTSVRRCERGTCMPDVVDEYACCGKSNAETAGPDLRRRRTWEVYFYGC